MLYNLHRVQFQKKKFWEVVGSYPKTGKSDPTRSYKNVLINKKECNHLLF